MIGARNGGIDMMAPVRMAKAALSGLQLPTGWIFDCDKAIIPARDFA